MAFPKTVTEFRNQGYTFDNKDICRSCNQPIGWIVTPKGRRMPLNMDTLESHFATCPDAKKFRKK